MDAPMIRSNSTNIESADVLMRTMSTRIQMALQISTGRHIAPMMRDILGFNPSSGSENDHEPDIDNQYQDIQNIIFENIKNYQKYSWFSDWYERKYNKELLIFLFESEIYRKEIGRFNIYTKHIFIETLKNYRIRATEILKLLEQEIEK